MAATSLWPPLLSSPTSGRHRQVRLYIYIYIYINIHVPFCVCFQWTTCVRRLTCVRAVRCMNGGTCVAAGNSFQCNCRPGYRGARCERTASDCSPRPCPSNTQCKYPPTGSSSANTGQWDRVWGLWVIRIGSLSLSSLSLSPLSLSLYIYIIYFF